VIVVEMFERVRGLHYMLSVGT